MYEIYLGRENEIHHGGAETRRKVGWDEIDTEVSGYRVTAYLDSRLASALSERPARTGETKESSAFWYHGVGKTCSVPVASKTKARKNVNTNQNTKNRQIAAIAPERNESDWEFTITG